MVVIGSQNTI